MKKTIFEFMKFERPLMDIVIYAYGRKEKYVLRYKGKKEFETQFYETGKKVDVDTLENVWLHTTILDKYEDNGTFYLKCLYNWGKEEWNY